MLVAVLALTLASCKDNNEAGIVGIWNVTDIQLKYVILNEAY